MNRTSFLLCAAVFSVSLSGCAGQYVAPLNAVRSEPNVPSDKRVVAYVSKEQTAVGDGSSHVRRITNKAGWEIPGLAESKLGTTSETYLSRTVSPRINLTELEPDREVVSTLNSYFAKGKEEIIVSPFEARVIRIERFSIDDRPFCYIVYVKPLHTDPRVKETLPPESLTSSFAYYDEDNDGRFEVFKTEDLGVDPLIPKWVLKSIKPPQP